LLRSVGYPYRRIIKPFFLATVIIFLAQLGNQELIIPLLKPDGRFFASEIVKNNEKWVSVNIDEDTNLVFSGHNDSLDYFTRFVLLTYHEERSRFDVMVGEGLEFMEERGRWSLKKGASLMFLLPRQGSGAMAILDALINRSGKFKPPLAYRFFKKKTLKFKFTPIDLGLRDLLNYNPSLFKLRRLISQRDENQTYKEMFASRALYPFYTFLLMFFGLFYMGRFSRPTFLVPSLSCAGLILLHFSSIILFKNLFLFGIIGPVSSVIMSFLIFSAGALTSFFLLRKM
jgi:hypothetical protein